jgi:DNA primase
MFNLSDLFYSLSLDLHTTGEQMLQKLYQEDPENFLYYLEQHYVVVYQEEVLKKLGVTHPLFNQEQIDSLFKQFAIFFHKNANTDYFKFRGITENQIEKFQLGSTHCLSDSFLLTSFLKSIKNDYPEELIISVLDYHLNMKEINTNLFNSPHFTTYPSFDNLENCKGICYRTEHYEKLLSFRNLHKFFVSHAPSFIFNYKTITQYDELYVVEGVFDVLALDRIGINNVISPSYTKISKYQYEVIKDKKLNLAYDLDKGGLYGLKQFKDAYPKANATFNLLPTEKDFDEMKEKQIKSFLKSIKKHI